MSNHAKTLLGRGQPKMPAVVSACRGKKIYTKVQERVFRDLTWFGFSAPEANSARNLLTRIWLIIN